MKTYEISIKETKHKLVKICSNDITVSFVVTTETSQWTMTKKNGSLILSENHLLHQNVPCSYLARDRFCRPTTYEAHSNYSCRNLSVKYCMCTVSFFTSDVCRCANLQLSLINRAESQKKSQGEKKKEVKIKTFPLPLKSDVISCPLNSRLACTHKNPLMRFQATAGSCTENKHWQNTRTNAYKHACSI